MKFEELEKIDCSEKIEKRSNGSKELSYLSWAWAWSIFKKKCPDATYSINKFKNANGEIVPYMYDVETGYMVNTEITAEGISYEMWLPVMNTANKAMKSTPYEYTVKNYGKTEIKTVEAASMFDINKTIMRCLVKNMAMFGLGLYIYAGEDLPEKENQEIQPDVNPDEDLINGFAGIADLTNLKLYYENNYKNAVNKAAFIVAKDKRKKELENEHKH